jgi:phosphoglycerate dehydrogenase-like enzyme
MQVIVPDYLVDYFTPLLRASDPTVELVPLSLEGQYTGSLENAEALYKFYASHGFTRPVWGADVLRRILREAPRLRWIHSGKAGVEDLLIPELVESDIVLTNGAGAPKRPIAETVLGYILMDTKQALAHLASQREGKWQHEEHRELTGLTVAILGLGSIGLEIARLCRLLDMRVIGTKRNVSGEPLPNVDQVFPSSSQNECVSQADYVVVAAALTPETREMVNASTFAAMRPDAVLINIARGGLIDQRAIVDALRTKRIRFAYLDVHEPEPLPPDSPFWNLPNVVITPHNSPNSQRLIENMTYIFVDNFRRFCEGNPLLNVVNKRTGY